MLPIAYVIFLILNNKRSYIGDAVGSGGRRVALNVLLVIALAMATIGSVIKIKGNVIDKLFPEKSPTAAPTDPGTKEVSPGDKSAAGGMPISPLSL